MPDRLTAGNRLAWPEATQGLGVIAVVLFHVLVWYHDPILGTETGLHRFWEVLNKSLGLVRMPILFALSRVFAARGLMAGWGSGTALTRILGNYYIYVVWLFIYFLVSVAVINADVPHSIHSFDDLIVQLAIPDTSLWFVFALAVYAVVIAVFVALNLPTWAVVSFSVLSWLLADFGDPHPLGLRVIKYFVFFAIGVYYSRSLILIGSSSRGATVGWLGGFLGLAALVEIGGAERAVLLLLLAELSSIPAAFAIAGQLCKWTAFSTLAAAIGSRTLPIYLLHAPILMIIVAFVGPGSTAQWVASPVLDALMPLGLTSAVIALALVAHWILSKLPWNPLFNHHVISFWQAKKRPRCRPNGDNYPYWRNGRYNIWS